MIIRKQPTNSFSLKVSLLARLDYSPLSLLPSLMSWFDFKCMSKFSFHCHTCMLNVVCATMLYHWLMCYKGKGVNKWIDNSYDSWINDLVLDLDEMGILCSNGRLQILLLVILALVIFILFPSLLRKPHSSEKAILHKAEKLAVNDTRNNILLLSYSRWINSALMNG